MYNGMVLITWALSLMLAVDWSVSINSVCNWSCQTKCKMRRQWSNLKVAVKAIRHPPLKLTPCPLIPHHSYYKEPRTNIQRTQNLTIAFRFMTNTEKIPLPSLGKPVPRDSIPALLPQIQPQFNAVRCTVQLTYFVSHVCNHSNSPFELLSGVTSYCKPTKVQLQTESKQLIMAGCHISLWHSYAVLLCG